MDEPLNDHQRLALEGLERMLREQLPKGPEWQRDYIRRSRSYYGRRPMTKAERLEELDALCTRFLAAQEWIKQQGRAAGDQPVPPVAAEQPPEKAIGARLVRECLRLGFTQQSASEAVGCARRTWFSYESGATMPDALMLHRLDLLGFDVLYIVTGRVPGGRA
jgi:hypothetical protein